MHHHVLDDRSDTIEKDCWKGSNPGAFVVSMKKAGDGNNQNGPRAILEGNRGSPCIEVLKNYGQDNFCPPNPPPVEKTSATPPHSSVAPNSVIRSCATPDLFLPEIWQLLTRTMTGSFRKTMNAAAAAAAAGAPSRPRRPWHDCLGLCVPLIQEDGHGEIEDRHQDGSNQKES